jgi:hypothetical protein
MRYADLYSATDAQAMTEKCPTCRADPGAACVYVNDLFRPGPDRELLHERGAPLAAGVHNARKGIIKARLGEQYRQEREALPPVLPKRKPQEVDDRIIVAALAGKTASQIATAEGTRASRVREVLRAQGIIPLGD